MKLTGIKLIRLYALLSVTIVSLMGFAGVITFPFKGEILKKIILFLVSFSAGALFGDAFLHLLPEAVEKSGFTPAVSLYVIIGILTFFILEKIICWRHCHIATSSDHPHPYAWMNLIGDGFHNIIDGMVITGSYLASPQLGFATTLAVILHEIPQEIGDYSILIHGGFGRIKALIFNFAVQLSAFLGVLFVFSLSSIAEALTAFLIPFTAGGFIYIAGSDIIPELKKETALKHSLLQLVFLILGISLMFLLLFLKK